MSRDLSLLPLIIDHEAPMRSIDDLFEAWWHQYPRRVAKGAARKSFAKVLAKKIATFDQLLNGAMRYAAEREGEDPTYTAHPTTWLNGERWLDEPKPRYRKALSFAESAMLGIMNGLTEEDFQ